MQRVIIPPRTEAALAQVEKRCMEFAEILAQVIELLAREKRLSYRGSGPKILQCAWQRNKPLPTS